MPATEPRIALVAPWPPPLGGMSVQARGLAGALRAAGTRVEVVRTNARLGPIARIKFLRGVVNLAVFLTRLVWTVPRVDVLHVLAASGLTFFVFSAPAIVLGRLTGRRVIVNYRGGLADDFLAARGRWVRPFLRRAHRLVVPSGYLEGIFRRAGYAPEIVPNYVDVDRFTGDPAPAPKPEPEPEPEPEQGPRIVVTRNLEPIYNVRVAIDATARIRERHPNAELWIAGTGSERAALEARARELGIADAVRFLGRVPNEEIPALYRGAAIALNPTNVDNMPISVLEAFAAGVPVVSTRAGGVPFIVEDEVSGLLADVGDADGLARACVRILDSADLANALRAAGRAASERYRLSAVVEAWRACYREAVRPAA